MKLDLRTAVPAVLALVIAALCGCSRDAVPAPGADAPPLLAQAAPPEDAVPTGAAAAEPAETFSVTVRIIPLGNDAGEPRELAIDVPIGDEPAPPWSLVELDPYSPAFRIEVRRDAGAEAEDFRYFLDRMWERRYQIDYAGQVVHTLLADNDEDALAQMLDWLRNELSQQYFRPRVTDQEAAAE